jgi:SAM-dependent methyltransferase
MQDVCSNDRFYDTASPALASAFRDIAFSPCSLRMLRRTLESIHRDHFSKSGTAIRWADVGCGLGRSYRVARELGYEYCGIDCSLANIEQCRKQFPDGTFVHADWLAHAGEYDLVTFVSSLHHFPDWQAALSKAFSVLSPDGVVLVDHEPNRLYSKLYRWYRIHVRRNDPRVIGMVEIHWFGKPSILPGDLPHGTVEYNFDYFPWLQRLHIRTRSRFWGRLFESYRKVMPKSSAATERK